jgi:hypothetical protein
VRSQGLVLSTDAVPAGTISKWEWYVYTGSGGTFNNFKLRCCHTNLTALTNNFTSNYASNTPVEVYSRSAQYIAATPSSWFGFDFDTTFQYDGKNNLIMEVDWNTDSGGYAYCRASSVASRFVYSPNGGGPYLSSYLHYQRITVKPSGMVVAPTSLGRVKSLYQ